MQTSSRFKLTLGLLAVVALGVVVAITLSGGDDDLSGGTFIPGASDPGLDPSSAGSSNGLQVNLSGSGERPAAKEAPSVGGGAIRPGMRPRPDGPDYSDPAQRLARLEELLTGQEIDWREVGKLLAIMTEPIPEELRHYLLDALRGGRRTQVVAAFQSLRDASFVPDLFAVVDDPTAARGARAAALQALWGMPGGDDDAIALQFESRLSGDLGKDRDLLYSIARRGGIEATRAIVQYITASKQPAVIPDYILKQLDFDKSADARRILVDELRASHSDETLGTLVLLAGRQGGGDFAQSLMALDTDQHKPDLRAQVYRSLAHIGDEMSIDYLLGKAEETGTFGEHAISALKTMPGATLAARAKLTKALESGGLNARPELFKESLLQTLGRLRHEPAVPAMVEHLDDASPRVQRAAIKGLGGVGRASRPHVQKIAGKWAGADLATRVDMAIALGNIGGDEALGVLNAWKQEVVAEGKSDPARRRQVSSLERTIRLGIRSLEDAKARMANQSPK
jgi:hypothetical protein